MSSVKAAKMMKGSRKRGKVRSMRIEHAAKPGTFISHLDREHVPSPHGMYGGGMQDEKPTAHPSISHLVKHVKTMMSGAEPNQDMGDEGNETAEPAEQE